MKSHTPGLYVCREALMGVYLYWRPCKQPVGLSRTGLQDIGQWPREIGQEPREIGQEPREIGQEPREIGQEPQERVGSRSR